MPAVDAKTFQTPQPRVLIGTSIWFDTATECLANVVREAGRPLQEFLTYHVVLGNCSEFLALELMGIPWSCLGCAESRGPLRNFAKRNFAEKIRALWTTPDEAAAADGFCRLQGKAISIAGQRPHCSSSRLPVPQRGSDAARSGSSSVKDSMVNSFLNHLESVKPYSVWAEFPAECERACDNRGRSVFKWWCSRCHDLGYFLVHFNLPHGLWQLGSQQKSLICCGFPSDAGAKHAGVWLHEHVRPMLRSIQHKGAIPVWSSICKQPEGTIKTVGWLETSDEAGELDDASLVRLYVV